MVDGGGDGGVDDDMFLLCMQNKEKFHFGDFLFYVFRNIYDEIFSDDILMLMETLCDATFSVSLICLSHAFVLAQRVFLDAACHCIIHSKY